MNSDPFAKENLNLPDKYQMIREIMDNQDEDAWEVQYHALMLVNKMVEILENTPSEKLDEYLEDDILTELLKTLGVSAVSLRQARGDLAYKMLREAHG